MIVVFIIAIIITFYVLKDYYHYYYIMFSRERVFGKTLARDDIWCGAICYILCFGSLGSWALLYLAPCYLCRPTSSLGIFPYVNKQPEINGSARGHRNRSLRL